ncbi:MAG: histidine kinase [bacterium]|nr:histidine kinase [bacterium]
MTFLAASANMLVFLPGIQAGQNKLKVLKLMCRKAGFLLLIINLFYALYGNEGVEFHNISPAQGLSQSTVHSIFQDSKGFMWFGTRNGLNRYDGYEFKKYYYVPGDPTSLSDNTILTIYEDRAGRLWVGTHRGGINILDREKDTFSHFQHDPADSSGLGSNDIQVITGDKTGTIWIGTWDQGLHKFDSQIQKIRSYSPEPGNPHSAGHKQITSMCTARSGGFWFGTAKGVKRFDPEKEIVTGHYAHDPGDPGSLSSNVVSSIAEGPSGLLWVGTYDKGLNCINTNTHHITHYRCDVDDPFSISKDSVYCLHESKDGVLWAGIWRGGLDKFNSRKKTFRHFRSNPNNPLSLSHNSINSIYESRSGILWIGTFNKGVDKYVRQKDKFLHFKEEPTNPNSLNNSTITAICEDKTGALWVGTFGGGLNKYQQDKKRFIHYIYNPKDPRSPGNNFIYSIFEDSTGTLWVGTIAGTFRFEQEKETFTRFRHKGDQTGGLSYDFIMAIMEDHQGVLWFATKNNGLYAYNAGTETPGAETPGVTRKKAAVQPEPGVGVAAGKNTIRCYKPVKKEPGSLSYIDVRTIYETRSGILWVGTFRGLNRFNRETGTFTRYLSSDEPGSIAHNDITCLCEDHRGAMWIGTSGGGLNKWEEGEGKFVHFNRNNGLPDDIIHGIMEDNQGVLWISTSFGLTRFDTGTGTFVSYTARDGLQNGEFSPRAFYKAKSGEMYFGGTDGFNAFYPERLFKNLYIPPVVITGIKVFRNISDSEDNARINRELTEKKEIRIRHDENTVILRFAALDYTDPAKNRYAYMMQGIDKDWVYSGSKREAVFTGLPPGEYVFKVKGSNNSGVWNEKGVTQRITVLPSPWRVWINVVFPVIILATLVFLFYRLKGKKEPAAKTYDIDADAFFKGYAFTEREMEIIKMLLKGKSKKEIEEELFISPHTVKNNIYSIYRKLGVKNRLDIITLFPNLK